MLILIFHVFQGPYFIVVFFCVLFFIRPFLFYNGIFSFFFLQLLFLCVFIKSGLFYISDDEAHSLLKNLSGH